MIIKENVTLYTCDHCGKKLFRKSAMTRHEKWCNQNPENFRACSDCSFIQETHKEYEVAANADWPHPDSITRSATAFRCTKLDKMIYPFKVEKKGLIEKYPETFKDQSPMPKVGECEHYEFVF